MKKRLLIAAASIFVGLVAWMPVVVQVNAQSNKDAVCEGISLTGGSCQEQPGQPTINSTLTLVINILSMVVGVAAVIMIIIGGLRYITSGGDSAGVNGAKNTILYAVIGLVIVALAQVIVRFVLDRVTTPPPQ